MRLVKNYVMLYAWDLIKKHIKKYNDDHYDTISVSLPKGSKQFLTDYANGNGITKTQLVKNAIEEYCNVDLDNDFGLKD